jgi:hypothetical protein
MKSSSASSRARSTRTPAARRPRITSRGPASKICGASTAGPARRRPSAEGGELRHPHQFQRLREPVEAILKHVAPGLGWR